MSVISNLPATPNRIEIVYRYLSTCDDLGVPKVDLHRMLCPPALKGGIANDVVNEANQLGLIEVMANGNYRLSSDLSQIPNLNFLEWLELRLLDLVQAEQAGQSNFPYALAWLLEQDPAKPFEFGDNITDLIAAQCGTDVEAFEMTNRARSQNFVYWAQYLGYAWRLKVGNVETIMPDPTQAIERHLPQLFEKSSELLIEDLLHTWAIQCPVLEGGAARRKIAERCQNSTPRDPKTLSRSTSIALLRLQKRGAIKLERRADAIAYTLNIKPNPMPISHITWRKDK